MRAFVAVVAALLSLSATIEAAVVQLGSDVLATNSFRELRGKRIALLTNPSGVNSRIEWTLDVLRAAKDVKLVALFAAEHGLNGDIPAGTEFPSGIDKRTGLPVHSLYGPGPTRHPTAKMLKGLDALVYDIQDTGCRSYTFISTMGMAMEACAEAGVEFIVLDRPNPLGGERVEGPLLELKYRSHVGQWKIPYAYGLTCGELARMINGEGWIKKPCKLTVVPMKGWRRGMAWRDTGLAWIPTSPHIPHGDSPLHYASTGVMGEIGGVSIGIGYTLPFQCIAAPWLDSQKLAGALNGYRLPGVRFQPVVYKPFYGAFSGRTNMGVQIHFTQPTRAPLMAINFYALEAVRRTGGRDLFAEAARAKKSFAMFDKVNGTDAIRRGLMEGKSASAIVQSWRAGEEAFRKQRQKYLLY